MKLVVDYMFILGKVENWITFVDVSNISVFSLPFKVNSFIIISSTI